MVIFAKTPVALLRMEVTGAFDVGGEIGALLRMEVTGAFDVGGEIGDERPGAFGRRSFRGLRISECPPPAIL